MDVADDMIWFLEEAGLDAHIVEVTPATKVGKVVTIATYGGRSPDYTHDGPDARRDHPRFQVMARDFDPAIAKELAGQAQQLLLGIVNQTVNGTWYLSVSSVDGPPSRLKIDDQQRTVYVASYEADKAVTELGGSA